MTRSENAVSKTRKGISRLRPGQGPFTKKAKDAKAGKAGVRSRVAELISGPATGTQEVLEYRLQAVNPGRSGNSNYRDPPEQPARPRKSFFQNTLRPSFRVFALSRFRGETQEEPRKVENAKPGRRGQSKTVFRLRRDHTSTIAT